MGFNWAFKQLSGSSFKSVLFRPMLCHFPACVWRSMFFKEDVHSKTYGIFCIGTRIYPQNYREESQKFGAVH